MKILLRNKREAEQLEIKGSTHGFISVTDPGVDDVKLHFNTDTLLIRNLKFDDILSIDTWQQPLREPVLFDKQMANHIFDDYKYFQDIMEILVIHCHAGISRSAAIATFLAKLEGIDSTPYCTWPKSPNALVSSVLRHAWYERTGVLVP